MGRVFELDNPRSDSKSMLVPRRPPVAAARPFVSMLGKNAPSLKNHAEFAGICANAIDGTKTAAAIAATAMRDENADIVFPWKARQAQKLPSGPSLGNRTLVR